MRIKKQRPIAVQAKPFINNYHVNEVPLPYYNPLQDPNLKNYFENQKNIKHIEHMGYLYQPQKNYNYSQRRAKNAYKFINKSCNVVPRTNILSQTERMEKSELKSFRDDYTQTKSAKIPLTKRKYNSQILSKIKPSLPQLADLLLKRPNSQTVRRSQVKSSDGKSRIELFAKRNISSNKRQNGEENDIFA